VTGMREILSMPRVVRPLRPCHSPTKKPSLEIAPDHLAAGLTYLQFPIQVCFTFTSISQLAPKTLHWLALALRRTWFSQFNFHF